MSRNTIYTIVAVVVVLAVVGYALGWFGGAAPPPSPAATAPAPPVTTAPAPATTTPATPAPTAPAQ